MFPSWARHRRRSARVGQARDAEELEVVCHSHSQPPPSDLSLASGLAPPGGDTVDAAHIQPRTSPSNSTFSTPVEKSSEGTVARPPTSHSSLVTSYPTVRMEDITAECVVDYWSCVLDGERYFRSEGLVLLPDGRFVVSDSINNKVKVFSAKGLLQGTVGAKGKGCLRKPRAVGVFEDGTLAVYDLSDRSIKVFSPGGQFVHKIQGDFTQTPAPLAVSPEREVIVPHGHCLVHQAVPRNAPPGAATYRAVHTTIDLGKARGIAVSREIVALCGMNKNDALLLSRLTGCVVRRLQLAGWAGTPSGGPGHWPVGLQSSLSGVCFDAQGNCFLLDTDNNSVLFAHRDKSVDVVCFHCDTWIRSAMQRRRLGQMDAVLLCPKSVCVDASGQVLVLENLGGLKTLRLPTTRPAGGASPRAAPTQPGSDSQRRHSLSVHGHEPEQDITVSHL